MTTKALTEFVVDHRRAMVALVALVSALLALCVPHMQVDVTLKAGINTSTVEYKRYQEFLKIFGSEDFVLVAIKMSATDDTPAVLNALKRIAGELGKTDKIIDIFNISTLKVFQEHRGVYGTYPLVRQVEGHPELPEKDRLESVRKALPLIDMLLSKDGHTFGIVIGIDDKWSFDVPVIEKLLENIESVVKDSLPPGCEFRMIGGPVIRQAIQHYNVQTAVTFSLLCCLICTGVAYYIFKSLRVMLITGTVVGLCVLWILGLMAIIGVQLNSTTALSFGLVLISSVEPVIHLVTHFNQSLRVSGDRVAAAKEAVLSGAGPCLVTSLTTALGFSSLIVASFPMVRQLGMILSLGPIIAFLLAVILTPAFLIFMKPPPRQVFSRMSGDLVAVSFHKIERFVFSHHRLCAVAILGFIAVMLAGAPFIQSDTQLLRMLTDSTKEIKDLRFVEKNLTPVGSLELVFEAGDNAFRNAETWKKVKAMNRAVEGLPEVAGVDSVFPLLEYLHGTVSAEPGATPDIFVNPSVVPQLLMMISLSEDGRRMVHRHIDERFSILRTTVRIKNSPDVPIGETIDRVRSEAATAVGEGGKVYVTGDLAVFESQASDIVKSQASSLILAVFYMSVLLTIQFRSLSLGIVSLLPQILPQAVIFGIMGWFGISLDSVTVFAAAVSIGLTVDNTVHYLSQLKKELKSAGGGQDIQGCLSRAYQVTARAMISNHAVIFFGFMMLLISPYRPVIFVGILGSAAIFFSLLGDLVFMPSVILSSKAIRRLMTREMMTKK